MGKEHGAGQTVRERIQTSGFMPTDTQIDYVTSIAHFSTLTPEDKIKHTGIVIPIAQLPTLEIASGIPKMQGKSIRSKMTDAGVEGVTLTEDGAVHVLTQEGVVPVKDVLIDRDLTAEIRTLSLIKREYTFFKRENDPLLKDHFSHPILTSDQEQALSRIAYTTKHRIGLSDPKLGHAIRSGELNMDSLRSGELGKDGILYGDVVDQFVLFNQRFVKNISNKYYREREGIAFNEIVAAGQSGLIRAAQLFDGSTGIKFSTYANNWIKQSINRFLQRERSEKESSKGLSNVSLDAEVASDGSNSTLYRVLGQRDEAAGRIENTIGVRQIIKNIIETGVDKELIKYAQYVLQQLEAGKDIGPRSEIRHITGISEQKTASIKRRFFELYREVTARD